MHGDGTDTASAAVAELVPTCYCHRECYCHQMLQQSCLCMQAAGTAVFLWLLMKCASEGGGCLDASVSF